MVELPAPAAKLELERLLGAWYVLISNQGFWRARTHPRIEHDRPAPGSRGELRSSMRFRQPDLLGRVQRKVIYGGDVIAEDGAYVWRGEGLLRVVECRWCVPLIDPEGRWVVAWFGRTNLGRGGGLGIHTRDPSIPQAMLDEILAQVRAHPFLAEVVDGQRRCDGLYATVQDWIPPQPYEL